VGTLATPRERRGEARRAAAQIAVNATLAEEGGSRTALIAHRCPVCDLDGHGRPFAPGSGLHLSASASGRWAVVAVAKTEVGVDIEVPTGCGSLPSAVLAAQESAVLATMRPQERWSTFLRFWTGKEAVAKADGRGLLAPLQQLDMASLASHQHTWSALGGSRWCVQILDANGPGVVAIATRQPAWVTWRHLNWEDSAPG
jgi:4'-phosphopantetheinyl transferase